MQYFTTVLAIMMSSHLGLVKNLWNPFSTYINNGNAMMSYSNDIVQTG